MVPSLHKCLAGILQNGEAVVLKHWYLDYTRKAKAEGLTFHGLGLIHDETQTEVYGGTECAERFAEIQQESMTYVSNELGFICPLEVEPKLGHNWAECH